jgi:hypothetical protein
MEGLPWIGRGLKLVPGNAGHVRIAVYLDRLHSLGGIEIMATAEGCIVEAANRVTRITERGKPEYTVETYATNDLTAILPVWDRIAAELARLGLVGVTLPRRRGPVDGWGAAAVNAYMDGMFQQAVTELGNGTKDGMFQQAVTELGNGTKDGMFQQAVTELGNGTKDGMFQQAVTELGNILDAYTEREKSALAEYLIAMELRRDLDWRKLSKIGFSKRTLNRLKNRALNDGGLVALVKQMRDDGQVKDDVEWFTAKIEKRRRPSKTAISGNQPSKTAISGNQPSKTAISGNQSSDK